MNSDDVPLAVDVRALGESLRRRRKRAHKMVLATLLGIEPNDLIRRELRRQIRVVSTAAAILLLLASAMAVLGLVAMRQRRLAQLREGEAVIEREAANRSERLARTRLAESLVSEGH